MIVAHPGLFSYLFLGLKKINVLFPISSPICQRVGRSALFFSLFFFFFFSQVKLRLVNRKFLMESLTSLPEHLTVFEYQ